MSRKVDSKRIDEIEKLMGEPAPLEVSDYEEKIRRNLLFASMIVFALTFLELIPNSESKFFGLSFDNLTPESIYIVLLIIVSYELVHYIWLVANKISYWRVRLTGTNPGVSRGSSGMTFGNEFDSYDHIGEQKHSNFYVWMLEYKKTINPIIENYDEKWKNLENIVFESDSINDSHSKDLLNKLNEIYSLQERLEKHLTNIRIDASMCRFDSWYSLMIRSQSLRWLVLDLILPILSGLGAMFFLIYRLAFVG
ncbi:hypothetical protein A6E13_18440 [Aliivibrio fischeri]|uniref:hypothetical protein n=1 Tax=Aliivibrio fischeri TaxID=668 RepID=UPI00080E0EBD|nr:hypothetical protein [Aliivibrio fischeri]OCH31081.1 hypothetical protein A6E13_18440 [Aliivibrio fischeri]